MPASSRIPFSAALLLVVLATSGAHAQFPLRINEIRIDQPQSDTEEYFELVGPSGFALTPFSYLVIGDGPGGNSGVIEAVVPLTGQTIGATGFFLVAEPTFTLGVPDLVSNLAFENGDNVTHLLVEGFFGFDGQDLDPNDDCILDITPWALVVDGIGVILEENPPTTTECHYGPPVVGPDGTFAPGHVKRCPDELGPFVIGTFDVGVDDTPGGPNQCANSLRAFGLLHTPVGQAQLDYDLVDRHLVLFNIGASGDDGCDVEAGDVDGFFFQCEGGMDPATLPAGAFVRDTRHNPDTGASQSISFFNTGANIEIAADFSGIGASSRRLMVLLDGQVVYDLPGHSGAIDFLLDSVPAGAKCYTHGNPIYSVTEYELTTAAVVSPPTGPPVLGNRICFFPENATSTDTLTHFRMTAAQVPEIVIIDEALLDFDFLQFRALGDAHMDALGRLTLSNIGASGDDGVRIMDLEGGRMELGLEFESLPIGASFELECEAVGSGTPPTMALAFQVLTAGPTLEVTPDFDGVGSSTYSLELLVGENVVYSEAGRSGPAVRYLRSDGELVQAAVDPGIEHELTLDFAAPIDVVGGPTIVADCIRMRAENPTAGPSLSWVVQQAWFLGIPTVDVVFAAVIGDPEFTRGDCNADGALGLADAIFGLGILFGPGGAMPPCEDACDINDDGSLGLADMISLLSNLFSQGPDPLPPYPGCGADPTAGDGLGCEGFAPCP